MPPDKPKRTNRRKRKPWRHRAPEARLSRQARKRENRQKQDRPSNVHERVRLRIIRSGAITQPQWLDAAVKLSEALKYGEVPQTEIRALAQRLGFGTVPSVREAEQLVREIVKEGVRRGIPR